MKLGIGLLATLVGAAAVAVAPGFHDVCLPDWKWDFGGWALIVAATCPDTQGRSHTSWLDLNDCVSNAEGKLVGKPSGRMGYSCGACAVLRPSGMSCACETTSGRYSNSTLDLNTIIKSIEGVLVCFDVMGVEVKSLDDAPA